MERPVTVNPQSDVFLEGVRFTAVLEVLNNEAANFLRLNDCQGPLRPFRQIRCGIRGRTRMVFGSCWKKLISRITESTSDSSQIISPLAHRWGKYQARLPSNKCLTTVCWSRLWYLVDL